MADEDEPFLSRWSRLKREQRAEPPPRKEPAAPADQTALAAAEGASVAVRPDGPGDAPNEMRERAEQPPPLDLTKLPSVEEMTADTDVTQFLDPRVPTSLRNAALGRMWALDPTIRDFIEVAENQWNWNVPGGAPGYGPLEPGTDIARLLAQATGAVWKDPATKDVDGDHEHLNPPSDPVASTAAVYGAQQHDLATDNPSAVSALPGSCDAAAATDRTEDHAAPQHAVALVDLPPEGVLRRHGGALPD